MRYARRGLPVLTMVVLITVVQPAFSHVDSAGGVQAPPVSSARSVGASSRAQTSGGVQAPALSLTGGSEYGIRAQVVPVRRPVVSALSVPSTAPAGRPPRVALRIDESGVRTVQAQVSVIDRSTNKPFIIARMGWVRTGRTLTVSWPQSATLKPGRYEVSLSAHDHQGRTLLRRARASGEASLTVATPVNALAPSVSPQAGVPTPAQSAAAGAVFPVAGAHSFGGPEDRFGAPRNGYTHQGQDVLAAEGTPIVAPLGGTILTSAYQAGGAGYYAVERTGVGFDLMFAHCQAGSLAVGGGQAVSAGQALCRTGQTGDATAPHLHFEMWVGGWQSSEGHPIDPLPYLEAWEHAATGG